MIYGNREWQAKRITTVWNSSEWYRELYSEVLQKLHVDLCYSILPAEDMRAYVNLMERSGPLPLMFLGVHAITPIAWSPCSMWLTSGCPDTEFSTIGLVMVRSDNTMLVMKGSHALIAWADYLQCNGGGVGVAQQTVGCLARRSACGDGTDYTFTPFKREE